MARYAYPPAFAYAPVDTETACGHPIENWTVEFRTNWIDEGSGPEVECRFYQAHLGNHPINRDTAIAIFGEQGVRTMENDATTHVAERMADMIEAAE